MEISEPDDPEAAGAAGPDRRAQDCSAENGVTMSRLLAACVVVKPGDLLWDRNGVRPKFAIIY